MDRQRPFLQEFESLGQYHDFWVSVIFKAPDGFAYSFLKEPIDQRQALVDAFESLHRGLAFAKGKLKDERHLRVVSELLRMAYEYYVNGDRKKGIQALQEAEGLIWPSQRIRLELAATAEMRAFGDIQVFASVRPRRYDGEGSIDSLGPGQRDLFAAAQSRAVEELRLGRDFKPFTLVLDLQGKVSEIRQPSFKKVSAEVNRLVAVGEISATVRTELVLRGILIHDLEERDQPHVSARAPVKNFKLEAFRFFLDDPSIFGSCDGAA
jgi:hypothetical protein